MRRFALSVSCAALFLLAASTAFATPAACPTTGSGAGGAVTYADLIATNGAGGCFVADKVFSNFTFLGTSTGGGTSLVATNMDVSYDTNAPTLIGFEFAMSMTVAGMSSEDVKLSYNINQISGIADITSLHNNLIGTAGGLGTSTVAETYCLGAFNSVGCASSGTLNTNAPTPDNFVTFAGVSLMSIFKDINVSGNASGVGNFASISGVRNAVDETRGPTGVPEPATVSYFLGGAGLLALGWMRRKATKR